MPMRLLRESDVQYLIALPDALAAVEHAFKEQSSGTGYNTPRTRVHQPNGVLHLLGAALTGRGYWGYKAYTATRDGLRFVVHLYDVKTGASLALIEANYLGQLRTGAASGVATGVLARSDAHELALFGTGFQAETQLEAIAAVKPLSLVRVYGRDADRRVAFAEQMSARLGIPVEPADSPQAAVRDAMIVTTATTSRTPVFDGNDLAAGAHINAAGGNSLLRAELDRTAVRRAAGAIFTDDLEQAWRESGELVQAYEANALNRADVRLLADVVSGRTRGRTSNEQVTLFASHGIALWDIALAATVYERAEQQQQGTTIDFGE